jgi:hypothetical protein
VSLDGDDGRSDASVARGRGCLSAKTLALIDDSAGATRASASSSTTLGISTADYGRASARV